MAININGNGTVTGISVGGLPDGIVDTDMIAALAVTNVKQSTIKAWGNISGTGTFDFRNSYGCSSLTDNGDGDYTINFTTNLSDDGYSFVATAENFEGDNNDSYCGVSPYKGSFATGSIRIKILRWRWDQYSFKDTGNVCFAVFL
jgi:hypothetical protein